MKGSDGYYAELRLAEMPTCLVEVAFMDNETPDNAALHDDRFLRLVARAIVQGIGDFYDVPCQSWLPIVQADQGPTSTLTPTPTPLPVDVAFPPIIG